MWRVMLFLFILLIWAFAATMRERFLSSVVSMMAGVIMVLLLLLFVAVMIIVAQRRKIRNM